MYPDLVKSLIPVASVAAASPQQIGWSAVERMAIVQDPKWRDGWYYDAEPGDGPWHGLAWPGRSPRSPTARPRSSMIDSVADR